jgi:hypothetical protein
LTLFQSVDRGGKVPRSALLLAILLLAAVAVLFLVSRRSSSSDQVMGGLLLDLKNTSVEGFLFSRDGGQYRFDKNEAGYWTLRGGTIDYLDQAAVADFLRSLEEADGGRLLPGTEIEDRRYEFNSPEAMRLTVFTADGRSQKLSVGVVNPVTGYFYASGAGRPGCFPITEIVRNRLAALPSSLQLPVLLPHFDRHLIQKVELWYGEELHVLKRFDDRWWMRRPEQGVASLGEVAAAYHQLYSDRVITRDGETWLLAREDKSEQVIYESSELIVNEFPMPRDVQARLQELELDPPWRRVRLFGAGINPDSTEAAAGMLEIAMGTALEDKRVPVLRRGNVLMTEGESLTMLGGPVGDFLDVGAISFLVVDGDSLRVTREGTLVLSGVRGEAPVVQAGTQARPTVESWQTVFPARSQRSEMREISYKGLVRNFIMDLDRMEILKILEPVEDGRVLSDTERVVVEVFGPGEMVKTLEFGFLDEDYLGEDLVTTSDGLQPVGLWRPNTGQLLQVPGHVLVTMRAHFNALK